MGSGIRGPALPTLGSFLPPGTRPFLKGVFLSHFNYFLLFFPLTQECPSPSPPRRACYSPLAPPQAQGLVREKGLSHHARCCPGGLVLIQSLSMRPHKAYQYGNLWFLLLQALPPAYVGGIQVPKGDRGQHVMGASGSQFSLSPPWTPPSHTAGSSQLGAPTLEKTPASKLLPSCMEGPLGLIR